MFDLGKDVVEDQETDSLGGGPLDSALYDFVIKMAYIGKSKGGAMSVNLTLESGKDTLRQVIYISSGDAKGNKFTYTDKNDKTEKPLPGYSQINSLCLLAVGKPLKELDPENKTIGIWNYDLKKEVPTEVPVLMDLMGEEISAGILQIIEDKYQAEGTRKINEIDKWFRTKDKLTVAEILAEATEAAFADKWVTKNTGITRDKSTGGGGSTGTPAAQGTGDAPAPKKSLFGS